MNRASGHWRWVGVVLAAAILSGCIGRGGREPAPGSQVADGRSGEPQAVVVLPRACPEIRVRDGTELIRRYAAGFEGEAEGVIYQASIGATAGECRGGDGRMILRIGVNLRLIAGPRGREQNVVLPLRIAVLRDDSAVLFSRLYRLPARLSPTRSTTLSEVYEITIQEQPRGSRDVIYVGFDEGGR